MKSCAMCGTDRDDVALMHVLPAGWNGFNNFADVCADCQLTKRFKTSARTKKAAPKAAAPPPNEDGTPAVAAVAVVTAPAAPAGIQITHRRTGELLLAVDSRTLANSTLREAALSGADLQHAVLRGTDLLKADLHLADLSGADLRGADLRGANLRGADLRESDFREAKLSRADLTHAVYDGLTRWPSDFDPRTSGARREQRNGA